MDLETQQVQFLLATLPTNVQAHCEASAAAALSCAASAGTINVKVAGTAIPLAASTFYIGFHQTVYSVSVAAPQGATELCRSLVASGNYPVPGLTNSNGARVCYHGCEKAAWSRLADAGLCTAAGFSSLTKNTGSPSAETTILALSNDSAYASCLDSCLKTGTILTQ